MKLGPIQSEHRIGLLRVNENVTLTGWLSAVEKLRIMQASDLFVLPSYTEGFGLAMLEAMATGLPAVATQGVYLAGEAQFAEAVCVVEPEVSALSAEIERLARNKDERRRRGASAAQLVEQEYA